MTRSTFAHRSRRRRTTFALFGRQRPRGGRIDPIINGSIHLATPDAASIPGDAQREECSTTVEAGAQQTDVRDAVARLQREAGADPRLLAHIPAPELDRLIEQTVHALWAESRVTAFVPLLAMRRIYEELGVADGTFAAGEMAHQDA